MHVVRCFEDADIIRHADSLNPQHDIETINLELIAADRESVAKRAERAIKMVKTGEKRYAEEAELGSKLLAQMITSTVWPSVLSVSWCSMWCCGPR